ncbi:putative holin-like toxin [Enterococcus cecorum]|uniref:putative holin-like toxin n=1 Tax=Enterococcus cecorum TaxID=44008 RepID=UPI003D756A26
MYQPFYTVLWYNLISKWAVAIPYKSGGAYECYHGIYTKGGCFVSVAEGLTLMLSFGMFIIALLTFVVELIKHMNNKK